MIITTIATFEMRKGREARALKLVADVKRQAEREQPGTLVYMVHRVLSKQSGQPTRQLYFYERYRNEAALQAHLKSSSWKRVAAEWGECFTGRSPASISFFGVKRLAAFARKGAIPSARR